MKRLTLIIVLISLFLPALPQEKKALTIDDLLKWNRITEKVISDDGSLTAFKTEPWEGDGVVNLYDKNAVLKASFMYATGINLTSDSRYLIFTIKPPVDMVKELKLKKTKKEDMPLDMLGIYDVSENSTDTIKRLKSYKLPAKWSGWIAYQTEPLKVVAPSKKAESAPDGGSGSKKENGAKAKTESADNGYTLCIRNLIEGKTDTIKFVTDYLFAPEAEFLICTTTGDDKSPEPGVLLLDLKAGTQTVLFSGKGKYKQLSIDKKAKRAAFIATEEMNDKTGNTYALFYWEGKGSAIKVAAKGTAGVPAGWIINENSRLIFGEKSDRLFFGTSPAYKLRDTTILEDDRPNVDVWHYAEGKLHTAQLAGRSRDEKKSYMAVYHAKLNKVTQLSTEDMPEIQLIDNGDASKVVAVSNLPYELESMWESAPLRYDVWLVDIMTGNPVQIKKNYRARIRVSPAGKYLYWYHSPDSSWYSYDINAGREFRLTTPATLPCYDEFNDVPNFPDSYQPAGWLKDDKAFLISDRYDIWSVDPVAGRMPMNITINGRKSMINYRMVDIDTENEFIDPSVIQYLVGTDESTRADAFYSLDLRRKEVPVRLMGGNFNLSNPVKAKNGDIIIYTKESFEMFPDYIVTDMNFRSEKRVTYANPQQKDFIWGSAELVKWTSLDGREIEGLLYKPEDFDPSKKYPIIVNFYERSSNELFRHKIPEAHRSTIDYHYYTSNGYLVFNPDIYYIDGYPGQSAYNCVMPGIMSLIEKGFVDEKHIGAQGHSWGGYQVAYMATRTNLFAAIESGAAVVNMYSAYGGIRWETGLNRSMQYEHEQSRIGATIWEAPHLYWENSPLFAIDKVTTPILIMSNDHDGHVPWWQGIEFFIAMRRLGKPAWLLNYNGEPHWPLKIPNKKDFQIRMSQFFGHYLKGEPMPQWMKEGIPANEKDFTLGY